MNIVYVTSPGIVSFTHFLPTLTNAIQSLDLAEDSPDNKGMNRSSNDTCALGLEDLRQINVNTTNAVIPNRYAD